MQTKKCGGCDRSPISARNEDGAGGGSVRPNAHFTALMYGQPARMVNFRWTRPRTLQACRTVLQSGNPPCAHALTAYSLQVRFVSRPRPVALVLYGKFSHHRAHSIRFQSMSDDAVEGESLRFIVSGGHDNRPEILPSLSGDSALEIQQASEVPHRK